jgi:hypothetical protein
MMMETIPEKMKKNVNLYQGRDIIKSVFDDEKPSFAAIDGCWELTMMWTNQAECGSGQKSAKKKYNAKMLLHREQRLLPLAILNSMKISGSYYLSKSLSNLSTAGRKEDQKLPVDDEHDRSVKAIDCGGYTYSSLKCLIALLFVISVAFFWCLMVKQRISE